MSNLGTTFMYDLLFAMISFISVIILSLVVLLVLNNIYYNWKEKKRRKLFEKYVDVISSYVTGEPVEIERLTSNLEFEVFAEVSDNTMLDFTGDQAKKVHLLLDRLEVLDFFKKRAMSYSRITRHNAIETLGYFKMPALKNFFVESLDKEPNEKNKLKILIALSFIADWQILQLITQRLTEVLKKENLVSVKLVEHIYTNIIKSLKEKNMMPQFMEFFSELKTNDKIPVLIKRDIMDACGSLHLKEASKAIIDYYYSTNDIEIKAAAVRNLGRIGTPDGRPVITDSMQSESWILRLVGAKAALVCGPTAKHNLKTLLSDPNYKVRINSAKSLAALGEEGLEVLRNERDSNDRFVRDTVKYVLDMNLNSSSYY